MKSLIWLLAILSACSQLKSQTIGNIYTEFRSAPDSTRTKVWWFHGETETTHEGITADLASFKEAGVGGVVYYDQVHGDAKGAFPVFSPEWWDALIFSAAEAKRLGLSFEINLSNGFVAGGPWITKEMSMKRLCQSQVILHGGETYNDVLPRPAKDSFWDVKTLAFPVPEMVEWEDKVLVSHTIKCDADTLLTYDFGKPFTARSLTYSEYCLSKHPTGAMNMPGPPGDTFYGDGYIELPCIGQLEASTDGVHWKTVRDIPTLYNIHYRQKTVSFAPVTARYFRLKLHDWNRKDVQRKRTLELRNVTLSAQAMTDEWENRAGLNSEYVGENLTPAYNTNEIIDPASIIDLTNKLQPDGKLVWTAPSGKKKWVIMRIAQTSTGGHTKHGRPGQMGLECDKLSNAAAKLQWDNFAQVIIDTLSAHDMKPVGVIMDSHEMGSQNWTFGYEKEFKSLQGYDITPYLPALLGYVVASKQKSDEVLFHHRQTIAYLVNHRYFAAIDTLAMRAGVMLTAQATGNGQSMTSDNIAAKGSVRRPQGEFWGKHINGCYDIKEAASAAHIYGKQIASAEAFTDVKYSQTLAYFKNLADYAFAYQLNEFAVCASAYQPWLDKRPGNTANKREYCLNRNNTMWELSRGFWDYQSRCAYLMRQGMPVVDICIYLGSEISNKILSYRLPDVPEGYDWDVCTDDALLRLMYAENGQLKTKSGMTYRVLVIERLAKLTDKAEAYINDLKRQGVQVYDARIQGDYGLKAFLSEKGLKPDAAFTSANLPNDRIFFAHRTTEDAEIYFFNNHSNHIFTQAVVLRNSKNKVAEFWNPDNGKRYALKTQTTAKGDLSVWLALDANESGFVILRHADAMFLPQLTRTFGEKETVQTLNKDWKADFLLPSGTKSISLSELTDWTLLEDEELKYFSGTAVYHKAFEAPRLTDRSHRVWIRLKGLEATSRIWVNGKEAGYIWCAPWETDITDYLKKGTNILRIEVANQLTNRMIGDLTLPEEKRTTYATTPIVKTGDPLLPAGITKGVELIIR